MARGNDPSAQLLFGLLALQTGLIDQGALVGAFHAWTRDKGRTLADHLIALGHLEETHRPLLEGLASAHLKRHGGDVDRSLASLPAGRSTREGLAKLCDPDLDATLGRMATSHGSSAQRDEDCTASYAVGTTTSDGQRFRVLRPHACGGLGAVFVALDSELNREVALKQILDHHADDTDSRQRFLLEAEVTGGLEHPGIVPVYGLGTYGAGRPFYAMRFIRGDSLKEAIERFHAADRFGSNPGRRTLELRKLLRRFLDVCNAIDYAHSRGVLHRDIKPGNIIVGKHGETLVVDWGLAKATGKSEPGIEERTLIPRSASGSAETLPGSALGTPAYMSPEQALGDLESLGPRSDVYSLGATLYCLLTGKPPQEGVDVGEILRKVQRGEFDPPRQIDPSIDAALEAICLKAMAPRPQHRYGSPHELADDLERWMADEPVSAHREPWTNRTGRWMRRHKPLVVGMAVLLTSAVVALSVGTVLISRQKSLAEANFRDARAAVDDYLTEISESRLLDVPRMEPLRKELLETALAYYRRFVERHGHDPAVRSDLGNAFERVGQIEELIGSKHEALTAYRKALEIRRALAHQHPAVPRYRLDFGVNHLLIGTLLSETDRPQESERYYMEGIALLEPLATDTTDPYFLRNLAVSYNNIAALRARTGQIVEAEQFYQKSITVLEPISHDHRGRKPTAVDLGRSYTNLGYLFQRTGRPVLADESYRKAIQALRPPADARSVPALQLKELSQAYHGLGYLQGDLGRVEEGIRSYRQAIAVESQLTGEHPDVHEYRRALAGTRANLGGLLAAMGRWEEAATAYREAISLQTQLVREHPIHTMVNLELARSYGALGNLQSDAGLWPDAEGSYREAIALLEPQARTNPELVEVQAALATTHNNLGNLLAHLDHLTDASRHYRDAIAIQERLTRNQPEVIAFRLELARSYANLGGNEKQRGISAEATARKAVAMLEKLAAENPDEANVARLLASSRLFLGGVLKGTAQRREALRQWRGAERLLSKLREPGPDDYYNLACARSLLSGLAGKVGDEEVPSEYLALAAIADLRRAVAAGYRNYAHMQRDSDLDPIRRRTDFRLLMLDLAFPADPFAGPR